MTPPEPVSSHRNPRVAAAFRLRRVRTRRATGSTLLEGPHLLGEAVDHGADILEIFSLPDDRSARKAVESTGAHWVTVTEDVLTRLAPTEHPRGPVAVILIPDAPDVMSDGVWLDVRDPGNAGTLIRTAAGFGLTVRSAPGSVDMWSPKVLRAAAGAHFLTSVHTGAPLPQHHTIATVVEEGLPVESLGDVLDPAETWTILVGEEAHGLDPSVVAGAEVAVTVPMPGGIESLNAAVSGSIVMYEFARWRNQEGRHPADG